MKKTALSLFTLLLAAVFMLPAAAHADTLQIPFSATVTAGETFTLSEWIYIDPSTPGTVYFNGDSFNMQSPITLDDSPFWSSFPLSANPGETPTRDIFTITVPAVIAPGVYTGYFSILGGLDINALDELTRVNIQLTVEGQSPVPEPGTWVLLVTGTGMLAAVVYGRRRTTGLSRTA